MDWLKLIGHQSRSPTPPAKVGTTWGVSIRWMGAGVVGRTFHGGWVRVTRTPSRVRSETRVPVRLCSSLPMRLVGGSVTSMTDVCEPRKTAETAGAAFTMTNFTPRFLHLSPAPKKIRRLTSRQRISDHDISSEELQLAALFKEPLPGRVLRGVIEPVQNIALDLSDIFDHIDRNER